MRKILSFVWEIGKISLIAFVLVVGLRMFVFQPFLVRGSSMEPNFHNWDYLIVDELSYRFQEPSRGEVIVFNFPQDENQRYIKRIIGLPGETVDIANGFVSVTDSDGNMKLDESGYVNPGETLGTVSIVLKEEEYFVMGDNRRYSSDSRSWGPLEKRYIIGRALFRVFPVSAFAKVDSPDY